MIADTHDKALAVLDSTINDLEDNLSDPSPGYDFRKRGFECSSTRNGRSEPSSESLG